jgi:hypothetical protein
MRLKALPMAVTAINIPQSPSGISIAILQAGFLTCLPWAPSQSGTPVAFLPNPPGIAPTSDSQRWARSGSYPDSLLNRTIKVQVTCKT